MRKCYENNPKATVIITFKGSFQRNKKNTIVSSTFEDFNVLFSEGSVHWNID